MRKILWRAAIVIPILALLVVVPLQTDIFKNKVEISAMNPLVTAEFENNRNAVEKEMMSDSMIIDEVTLPEQENVIARPEDLIVNDTPQPTPVTRAEYCIIIGSFKSQENANDQVQILKKEGFDPEIIEASNGFYRVSAIKYDNLNSAISVKDSLLKKYPGIWISKLK